MAIVYPHLADSNEVILEGKQFRNRLRAFEELKDWHYLIKNYLSDMEENKK